MIDSTVINTLVLPWLAKIGFAFAIGVGGYFISRWSIPWLEHTLGKSRIDRLLIGFIVSIARTIFLLFIAIAALSQLGLNTTSLVALVGAAGITVGLALKESLSNFAAGVMILIFRPFKLGDFINAAGMSGTIKEIGIFQTRLSDPTNVEIIVPNATLYNSPISNFSTHPTRRIEIQIGIDYRDEIQNAKTLIEQIFAAEHRVLKDPEPVVLFNAFGASGIDLVLKVWVNASDLPLVHSDLREQIKSSFDANGISIPYPHMVLDRAAK
ncbi:MAG: mechanosensitive ion channel family protein [Halothiobacillus sp.]